MCIYTYNGYMCVYLYMCAHVHGSNVFCRSAHYRFLQYQCTLGVVCLVQGSVESLCFGYFVGAWTTGMSHLGGRHQKGLPRLWLGKHKATLGRSEALERLREEFPDLERRRRSNLVRAVYGTKAASASGPVQKCLPPSSASPLLPALPVLVLCGTCPFY